MRWKRAMAALALGLAAAGGAAQARPYLMLFADDRGFVALDMGDLVLDGEEAQATVIRAPLDGAPFGTGKADLVKARTMVDCVGGRWRALTTTYADGHETVLGADPGPGPWKPLADDPIGSAVRDAACQNRVNQQSVSRDLNLGEILDHYRRAWGKAQGEPLTAPQLADRLYRAGR